jgi:membrane protein DedA with SNARE-associated domain
MPEPIQFLLQNGYSVLFLWIFFQQLGLPIPGAPMLLAAGVLSGLGNFNFFLFFVSAVIASLISDILWYQVGLRRGSKVLPFLCRISLDPDSCVRKTKDIFSRHGPRSLLVAKFVPGMTPITSPLAGIFRMALPRFFFYDGLGIFFWTAFYLSAGYLFSHHLEQMAPKSSRSGLWMGLFIPGLLAGTIAWKYIRRQSLLHQLTAARITPEEVKEKLEAHEDLLVLDIRNTLELEMDPQTIPGAFHLPLERLARDGENLPRDRDIILYCT